ncbi:unnamed protein product [Symbiodinium sp. CCMP2592]|nr:unnamed protein product [Symbiodinium sp. CCMP2592]
MVQVRDLDSRASDSSGSPRYVPENLREKGNGPASDGGEGSRHRDDDDERDRAFNDAFNDDWAPDPTWTSGRAAPGHSWQPRDPHRSQLDPRDFGVSCDICGQWIKSKDPAVLKWHKETSVRCQEKAAGAGNRTRTKEAKAQCAKCGKWVANNENSMWQQQEYGDCLSRQARQNKRPGVFLRERSPPNFDRRREDRREEQHDRGSGSAAHRGRGEASGSGRPGPRDAREDFRKLQDEFCTLDVEATIARVDEEKTLLASIADKILWHIPAPAMLAPGRTNAAAKLRVFTHAFGLLADGRPMLATLLGSIVSLHTDYGAEALLAKTASSSLTDILPYMHLPPQQQHGEVPHDHPDAFVDGDAVGPLFDDENFFAEEAVPQPEQDHDTCDLSRCLEGPDLNHVIHNITSGLEGVMAMYRPFLVGLKRVCRLLGGKESKRQLLATCFSSGVAVGFASEISKFQCEVHEKRWNTIAFAVQSVYDLEAALRTCWDLNIYLSGHAVSQPKEDLQGDEHGVHLPGANEALTSDHWWACLHIMREIAETQASATEYVNGCDCHSHLLKEDVGVDIKRVWENCPLRGRRCAGLSSGAFFQVVQRLLDRSTLFLQSRLTRSLTEEELQGLLTDFEQGRQYILSTYILKLSFWAEPLHCLTALVHWDASERCKALKRCLDSSCTHPRVVELRAHETECTEFLAGGGLWEGSFPYLKSLAAEMSLCWSSAWRVEGQHARLAYYFSLLTRKAGWLTGRQSNKTIALLYHDDPYTKYTMDLPREVHFRKMQETRLQLMQEREPGHEEREPRQEAAEQSQVLRRTHALQDLKALVKPRMYLSMSLVPTALYKLRGLLAPHSASRGEVAAHLTWDAPEQLALSWPTLPEANLAVPVRRHLEGAGDVVTQEALFWSVVHTEPARFRGTKVHQAASLSGVLVVQLHRIMGMDPERREATVSLKGAVPASMSSANDAGLALYLDNLTLGELLQIREWQARGGLIPCFDVQLMSTVPADLRTPVSQALQELVSAPEGFAVVSDTPPDIVEALDILAGEGVVVGPPWTLTETAKNRVEQCVVLHSERPLLRRCEGDLKDATCFQLILEMDAKHWRHEVVSKKEYKAMKKANMKQKASDPKIWYTAEQHATVSRLYLLALLLLTGEKDVPHVAEDTDYATLLGLGDESLRRPGGVKRKARKMSHVSDDWPVDGYVAVLHVLKYWAVLGSEVTTAAEHMELFNERVLPAFNINSMPSVAELVRRKMEMLCRQPSCVTAGQGSLEDTIAQQTLPTGPSSLEELFSFPEQLLDVVFAREGCQDRIMNLLSDGLHLSTDYSGVCAEREALRLMSLAVQKRTGVMLPQKLSRTCDIDPVAQKVLCHLSDRLDGGESCVFDDIHKQLVPLAQSWISQCDLGDATVRPQAFAEIQTWLQENGSWAVSQDHMTHFVKHNCNCIVHKKRPQAGGLSVNAAGNCCQAWSIEGKRACHAHASQLTLLIWTALRRQLASRGEESLFFQECTPGFDVEGLLSRPLSSSHKVIHVTTGPKLLGWPANRDRRLSAGLSLQELVWLGPCSNDEIQQDFEALFGRSCCLTGRVFFQASEDDMTQWIAAKMRKMGRVARNVPVSGPGMFQQVLTPYQLQRLQEYSRLQPERASLHDGTFIADLDHWPSSQGTDFVKTLPDRLFHALGSNDFADPSPSEEAESGEADVKAAMEEAFKDDNDMQGLLPKTEKQEDDDAPVTPPRRGRGRGRGGRSAREKDNKDKDAGGRGGRGKKNQPLTMCICPGCEWPKYPGSRFCSQNDHKRGYDNLMYQRRSRKDITEAQKVEFDSQMKSDEFAGRTVLEFVKDCPPELRKKTLFDFARFERSKGMRVSTNEQSGDIPMTERAFYKHCDNELYNDRNVGRDHGGFRGAEQLFIPAHRMRLNNREHFVENRIVEGSNNMAAPSQETRQMLSKHLLRQDVSFADVHFGMSEQQTAEVRSRGAKPLAIEPGEPDYDTPKKEKAVNLDRERPALHRQMEAGINKIRTDLNKSLQLTEVTAEKYRQHPSELLASDRAAVAYVRTFQWRLEAAARVAGELNEIKLLVPEAVQKSEKSETDQGSTNPPTPASAMTGCTQAEMTDAITAKKKMHFVDFLKTEKVKESQFWPGEADDLLPLSRLRELQEYVLNATDGKSFIAMKQQWQKAEKAAQGVAKGLKQSSDDVIKHLKSAIASRDRATKRKQTQEEKEALQKVKQEAADAAAEIKKRRVQEPATEPLFTADIAADLVAEKSEDAVAKMPEADWCYPWVIKGSEAMKLCMGEKTLQNTLAAWGAQYKRTLAQTKTACVTYPLEEKQGKESFLEAMALWVDKGLVDLCSAKVPGGESFHKSVWMYGCSNDMKTLTHLPNWACMLKVLASGEVRHVLFEVDSTLKALYDMKKITEIDNINAALAALKALDADSVKELLAKNAGPSDHPGQE